MILFPVIMQRLLFERSPPANSARKPVVPWAAGYAQPIFNVAQSFKRPCGNTVVPNNFRKVVAWMLVSGP
jgi:hypothetical protein